MMTNEQMPQGEAKKPLTRNMCRRYIREEHRKQGLNVGVYLITFVVYFLLLALFFCWRVVVLDVLGVLIAISGWYQFLGQLVREILVECGCFSIALDSVSSLRISKDKRGTEFRHFCFSHHGKITVTWGQQYDNIVPGDVCMKK